MKKAVLTAIFLIFAVSLLFGCTQGNGNDNNLSGVAKVTTSADASKALNDVSGDISGISNSLNEIDKTLTDTNA